MKITFLHSGSGDWVGMYIDDELDAEGHSLDEKRVAEISAKAVRGHLDEEISIESIWSQDSDLERYGYCCPKTLPKSGTI
jgi:hypothetical protein